MDDLHAQIEPETPGQGNVINAIANWCEAMHGDLPVQDALTELVQQLGAEAGTLVRTNLAENRPTRVALFDKLQKTSQRPLDADYALDLFGSAFQKSRADALWLGSEHADKYATEMAFELAEWRSARKMTEFVVLVLAAGPFTQDYVELHFRHGLSRLEYLAINAVLPVMARTWASRQLGLITKVVNDRRVTIPSETQAPVFKALLSTENPARLSRAEFRVCLLLSRGFSVSGVCAELSLADATVRSHLRSIYSKSGVSSLAELVFCLIGPAPQLQDREGLRA